MAGKLKQSKKLNSVRFIKNLSEYIRYFVIPSRLQKFSDILFRIIDNVNRFYSRIAHQKADITTFFSQSEDTKITYRGDVYLKSYLRDRFREMGMEDLKEDVLLISDIDGRNNNRESIDIQKVNVLDRARLQDSGFIVIPDWVRAVISLTDSAPQKRYQRSARRAIKKLEESEYSYHLVDSSKILDCFYHEFYRPYINDIYGESALFKEYSKLRLFSKKAYMINIKRENFTVGLVFILPSKKSVLYIYAAGIESSIDKATQNIVQDAIYYYSIDAGLKNGFKHVDFGLNRSFLNDGVLLYKKKWGANFFIPGNAVYNIALNRDTEFIKSFLQNNPLFIIDKGHLSCLFYVKERKPEIEEVEKLHKMWINCGASKLIFISASGFDFDLTEFSKTHRSIEIIHGDLGEYF